MGFLRSLLAASPLPLRPGRRPALAVLAALLLSIVAYRLRLAWALHDASSGWSGEPVAALAVLRQLGADVMLALAAMALVMAGAQLTAALPGSLGRLGRGCGIGLIGLLLLAWGALCQSHHTTLLATGSGVTVELLRESLAWAALRESLSLLLPSELAFLLLPLGAFALLLLWPARAQRALAQGLLVLTAGPALWALLLPAAALPESILHHPVGFLATDAIRTERAHSLTALRGAAAAPHAPADPSASGDPAAPELAADPAAADEPPVDAPSPIGAAQDLVLALPAPDFAHPDSERRIQKTLPKAAGAQAYNVLWVLMESTGLDYALKPPPGGDGTVAMPFLQSLTQKGYFLSNHFSAGNSSPRGISALLSGLYVMPEVAIFDVRKDNYLPSLGSYLGERYRRFLVTPASLDWYFPHAFLLHSGFAELWGYHALPVRKNAPGGRAHARDEAETVSFFLRRLDELTAAPAAPAVGNQPPFVAVYYSFIAHWPYPDYGDSTHVLKPVRPLNNYYNNLRYLDQQIKRIYEHLKQKNLLETTIIVFAGDHGEAFGQHPHNYTHSRASFNENYRTPALLLHPQLFPPRVFTAPTSHVDILPTLLDALGVAYEPRRLQGESLYQDQFRRKYIFLYGNEDTVSSISEDLIKLQISFKNNSCWAFNLKLDPEEKKTLSCLPYKAQQQALLLYRNNQRIALRRYNREAQARSTAPPPREASPVGSAALALPSSQPATRHAQN